MPRTKNDMFYEGSAHTLGFINPRSLKKCVDAAVKQLKKYSDKYDTLAFAGISGAIVGPVVAMKLKKECLLVRKNGDIRHSMHEVSGYFNCGKYIIIDDFICSGDTVNMIQKKIYRVLPKAECLGVLEVQRLKGTGKYEDATEINISFNLTEIQLKGMA